MPDKRKHKGAKSAGQQAAQRGQYPRSAAGSGGLLAAFDKRLSAKCLFKACRRQVRAYRPPETCLDAEQLLEQPAFRKARQTDTAARACQTGFGDTYTQGCRLKKLLRPKA